MPVTNEMYVPSYEELTVPELQLTSGILRAASLYFGKYCDNQCKEFMLCKGESNMDPRRCVNEGKEVTRCGFEFFQKVKSNCYEEFTQYATCVDRSMTMRFQDCRKTQAIFDKCAEDKLNISRPEPGYFSKIRLHETSRPRTDLKPLDLPEQVTELKITKDEPNTKNYPKYGFTG